MHLCNIECRYGAHAKRGHVLQQLQTLLSIKASGTDVLSAFHEKYGYKPRVGASLVHGAGCGVFMEGLAAAGSMVAVYPGLIIRDMRGLDELTCVTLLLRCVFLAF